MSANPGLAEAIRSELVRSGMRRPAVAETSAGGPADPAACARTGGTAWLADYQAATGLLPAADTPPWTEYRTPEAAGALAGGVLTITAPTAADTLFYYLPLEGLTAAEGTLVQARLRVAADGAGANAGACLALFDGQYLCVLWLRTDSLNLDGSAAVPCTLGDAQHRVALHVRGATVRAYVDGELLQTGAPAGVTALKAVAFGSWVDSTP